MVSISVSFTSRLKWHLSHETHDSPTVQWLGIQNMLEQAECDVLILLDCCCGASSTSETGNGVTEVIAACGFETWAPGVGEHSFTYCLFKELFHWRKDPLCSVAMLHSRVLSSMKQPKPRTFGSRSDEQRKTPIYSILTNEGLPRSIELKPLPPRHLRALELPASSTPPTSSSATHFNHLLTESSQRSLEEVWPDPEFKHPKVLISLALDEDQWLSTSDWKDWLSSVPAMAKSAKVEGIYKSDSTLVLLSLPVAVWDMLPQDAAVSFLGFIRSENLVNPAPLTLESSPERVEHAKSKKLLENAPGSQSQNTSAKGFSWACSECMNTNNLALSPERCSTCSHARCPSCKMFRKTVGSSE